MSTDASSSPPSRPRAAVVGGGPAGLMAAERLARAGAQVVVFDRMPSLARKFLLAGRGGLNLTHSEPFDAFLRRYGPEAERLAPALAAFTPEALRAWADDLGEATFVGSSGRVFPKSFKASPLLRAWLRRLAELGVTTRLRCAMADVEPGALHVIDAEGATRREPFDAIVLALGGASWPRLGSDGGWRAALERRGVTATPFAAANCGATVAWSEPMRRHAGAPI
ncbi:MAG TPA: NAD(P)/FAD-dependent oxidoreductase, partial [Beijerinckiaceae bacterium]